MRRQFCRGLSLRVRSLTVLCALSFVWAGCADDAPSIDDGYVEYTPEDGTLARVAYDTGLTQYLGDAEPVEVKEKSTFTSYAFDPEDGPVCMRGEPFRSSIRTVEGSNDLLIFLQGGGACWDGFCLAVTTAPAGVPSSADILDSSNEENPVKDWNVSYLPYCDGSLFIGDNTVTDDKGERIYAGLHNLSAALTVTKNEFPTPDRILFAGSSAGGFGTILGTPLVRYLWPNTPLYVVADSAAGIAHDGDQEFVNMLIDTFGARGMIPDDCTDCISDGNITGFLDYYLPLDDNIRVGLFTSWYDTIIARTFLQIDPRDFQESVDRVTTGLHEAFPDKYRRFIVNDKTHTALLGDVSGIVGTDFTDGLEIDGPFSIGDVDLGHMDKTVIEDMHLGEWIGHMLTPDGERWKDMVEAPDYEAVFGE